MRWLRRLTRSFAHPPLRPCIAEYGSDFPAFLAASHSDGMPPYVPSFAELEWAVAQASTAITEPPAIYSDVAAVGAEALPGTALRLQPGLRFVHEHSGWIGSPDPES